MDNAHQNAMKRSRRPELPESSTRNAAPSVKNRREFLLMSAGLIASVNAVAAKPSAQLSFVCSPHNDLYRALKTKARIFPNAAAALQAAPTNTGVLILADEYPQVRTPFDAALAGAARQKALRIYVEYPAWLPQQLPQQAGAPVLASHWERGVISSTWFEPGLASMRLLTINECHYVPATAPNADIVLGRVAGFQTAVYGLSDVEAHPILFRPSDSLMVASTKLSQFLTARYGPSEAWIAVWKRILEWLCRGNESIPFSARATVFPSFSASEPLPVHAEDAAFRRGVAWYANARLLVAPQWEAAAEKALQRTESVGPAPSQQWPAGDGRLGLLEGFSSSINLNGSQPVRWVLRSDCNGESSFAFALAGGKQGSERRVAANLVDFIFSNPMLAGLARANPSSPSFGLLNWDTQHEDGAYYGDDNARCLLGVIGTAAVLGVSRWDARILSCILGNFRTTGPFGFRGNRINESDLAKNGWRHYYNLPRTNFAPHYEAFLWAMYLWAYDKTRYRPLLDRAKLAIRATMEAYPQNWHWTNGLQQERARMLLPLSWLIRVDDAPQHREWLERIAGNLISFQDASGAIREELGAAGKGDYAPPASNAKYGTAEAPLIQRNGDPVCDLLYTTNFAFLGLHEATAATQDARYAEAQSKLAQFLCRIQVHSVEHPELNGAWFRAFDYGLWDYWASNADAGWGAWAIETGWTQAWIASTLAMRQMRASLWDLTAHSRIGEHTHALLSQFSLEGS